MCLFAGSHSSSVCSKLQLSLIVRLFKALQMSKCVAPHRFCNTRSPKLTTNIQMSKCLSCPTNISVLKILSSSSSFLSSCRANTSIRNHHYCEFYQCDSQIVGVVSTLQDLSRDSHPFSHNHIPAPSVISHNHISQCHFATRRAGFGGSLMCLCCCVGFKLFLYLQHFLTDSVMTEDKY